MPDQNIQGERRPDDRWRPSTRTAQILNMPGFETGLNMARETRSSLPNAPASRLKRRARPLQHADCSIFLSHCCNCGQAGRRPVSHGLSQMGFIRQRIDMAWDPIWLRRCLNTDGAQCAAWGRGKSIGKKPVQGARGISRLREYLIHSFKVGFRLPDDSRRVLPGRIISQVIDYIFVTSLI